MLFKKACAKKSVLGGFSLCFWLGGGYFFILIGLPLLGLFVFCLLNLKSFYILFETQVLFALLFSLKVALCAAFLSLILGFILAYTLARFSFFGRELLDLSLDIPFALPTASVGLCYAFLLSEGAFSFLLLGDFGSVVFVLCFVGLPFVVRSLEPVLAAFPKDQIDAAQSLGANFIAIFWRIILPNCKQSIRDGFCLALARALGEYGSVIFVCANIPFFSEILPVVIVGRLDLFDYAGAAWIGLCLLLISFFLLFGLKFLKARL